MTAEASESNRPHRSITRESDGEAMIPTAPVVRLHSARALRETVWLLKVRCPYCARTHVHGGGIDRTRVADFLGDRVSHCGADSYTLTDPDGVLR